jgi:hypothetical protein
MLFIYLHTIFHVPSFNNSFVFVIKANAKYRLNATAISLFYAVQYKKKKLINVPYFVSGF